MLNNISIFKTTNEWQSFSASTDCWRPHVSFTMDNREVRFMPVGRSISKASITCNDAYYSGSKQVAQNIIVDLYGLTLRNNVDYVVISNSGGTVAGEYPIVVKGINDYINTAKGVFIISKATPVITNSPIAKSNLVYNGSSQILLSGGAAAIAGYFMYENKTNAGTYSALWIFVPYDTTNYTSTKGYVTVTIAKATPNITSSPGAKSNLVYNGNSQPLLSGGTADVEGSFSYDSATNAGTYDASWTFIPTDTTNYKVVIGSVSVTIAKASGSIDTEPVNKSITYNGSSQELVTSGISHTGTMLYKLNNGTWGESMPTASNAGTYTIYYKASESDNYTESYSGSVSATIAKVTPTVTAPVAKTNLVYTGSAQQLATAGSTNWGTLKYSLSESGTYSTAIPSGTNATSYEVWYKVEGDSNINDVAPAKITVSIAKADPSYTAPTANNRAYDTTSKALLNAGAVTGGTIYYSSDNTNWSTTIPSGTNANTYTSYWKIVGDSNHNDKPSASISTTISAKAISSPTITLSQDEYTYSNSACQPTPTVKDGSTTIPDSEYTVSYTNNVNAGTGATVTITDKAGGNYSITTTNKTFTIIPVTPTVVAPTPKTLTFNNANQTLANGGSTDWGTIQYCLNNSGGTYSTSVPSASAANVTYKVWYKVVGNSNVNDVAPASIDCMIAEKRVTTPTITLDPPSYTYSGSQCKPTPTVKDGSTVIPSSEYTTTYSNNTNAGTATVTITDKDAGNYYISGTTTFAISKAPGSVTTAPSANSLIYNNTNLTLTTAGSGTGTMLYVLSGSTSWSTTIPTGKTAGDYYVCYKSSESTNYNESSSGSVKVTIDKVTPTVTAPVAKSDLVYNGSAQALIDEGTTDWGTLRYSIDGINYSTIVPSGTNASEYTVYYKVDGDSNINDVSAKYISVTINKTAPLYTAPTKKTGLIYNRGNQDLLNAGSTSDGTFKYSSDNSSWSTSIPQGKNANDNYTVYWKLDGDIDHADVGPTTISGISIAKVTPVLSESPTKASDWTYDGNSYTLASGGSMKHSSTDSTAVDGIFSYGSATNVGSYTATWSFTPTDTTNYNGDNGNVGTVTVSKANVSYSAPNYSDSTYDGNSHYIMTTGTIYSPSSAYFQYSADGSSGWSTTRPTAVNAGQYYPYYRIIANNSNYNDVGATRIASRTDIYKADQSAPTAYGASVGCGSSANATASGGGEQGSLEWSNGSSRSAVGSQDTQARWGGNSNYNASSWSNVVTLTVSMNNQSAPTVYGSTTTYSTTATATASGGGGVGSLEWESAQSQSSVGSHSTRARWSGNGCYNASPWSNYATVQMNKADQSAPTAYGDTTTYGNTATATASGGGGVGSIEWSNGNTRTATGTTTTYARWSGNGNYNASAWSNAAYLTVNKASRSITWASSTSDMAVGNTRTLSVNISAGSSDGTLVYSSSDTSKASINGSTLTAVGAGTSVITASITGGTNYENASTSFTLTVTGPSFTINVNVVNNTSSTVYYNQLLLMRSGSPISVHPGECKSTLGNTTHVGVYQNVDLSSYASGGSVAINGAMLVVWSGIGCAGSSNTKTVSIDKRTLYNGDTLTITYNG